MALILTSSIPSSLLGPSVASFILERTDNYIIVFRRMYYYRDARTIWFKFFFKPANGR